jgi:hypothetical protein
MSSEEMIGASDPVDSEQADGETENRRRLQNKLNPMKPTPLGRYQTAKPAFALNLTEE